MRSFVVIGKKLGLREGPNVTDSTREAGYLTTGQTFEVVEEVSGADGRIYFRLADGRGWVYDRSAKDFNKIVVQEVVPMTGRFPEDPPEITICLQKKGYQGPPPAESCIRLVASPVRVCGSAIAIAATTTATASGGSGSESSSIDSDSNIDSDSKSDADLSGESSDESAVESDVESNVESDVESDHEIVTLGSGVSRAWVEMEWGKLKKMHGLTKWNLSFDKAKRRFGCCRFKKRIISISDHFLGEHTTTDMQVRNTVLHEIAHALVGKEHGHDAVWKAKAISIGCDGCRCHSHAIATTVPKPFQLCCKNGCWSIGKYRKGMLSDRNRCRKCKGELEYRHNGKSCKAKAPSNKYELRCQKGCWSVPRQRRQKEQVFAKKRCKKCGGGVEFRRTPKKQSNNTKKLPSTLKTLRKCK